MPPTAPPARPGAPRNRLGAVTFVVVVLAAILAVFPATAGFGFLLCLLAIVPALLAYRRTRKGTATNQGRSFAAVLMAPAFLVVALVVGATTAPAQVHNASDTTALAAASAPVAAAAPAPLLAAPAVAPAPAPAPAAVAPLDPVPTAVPSAVRAVAPRSAPTSSHTTQTRQAPAVHTAAAPAPVPGKVASPPVPKAAPKPPVPQAPKPAPAAKPAPDPDLGSAPACDEATHYVNAKGSCVLRPVAAASAPAGATAKCNDGSYSSSKTHQGTCSRHGGVAEWL